VRRRAAPTIEEGDDADAAEAAAIRILGGAGQSGAALSTRLQRRGFSAAASEMAVTRCRQLGYVDDTSLARSVATRLQRSGHGASRIAAELRARGISRDAASSAMESLDPDDGERALEVGRRLVERELRRGDDAGMRRRIAGALQRRGFSGSIIAATLRRLSDEAASR